MSYDGIDLFSGIGWDIAARELGLNMLGLDYAKSVTTMRRSLGMDTLEVDLWNFDPAQLSLAGAKGLIGSPSCKKWSPAGGGNALDGLQRIIDAAPAVAGRRGKKRLKTFMPIREVLPEVEPEAALVLAPLSWAAQLQPEWIALEQVTQVQPVWDAIAEELRLLGYSVDTGIRGAETYGVPQTRKRSFLVANRKREVQLPPATHSNYYPRKPDRLDPGVQKWVTMGQALGWDEGPHLRSNYGTNGNHLDYGTRALDQPAATVTSKADRGKWVMGDVRNSNGAIRSEDQPSATITASMDNGNFRWRGEGERPEWPMACPSTTIVGSFRPDIVAAPDFRTDPKQPRQKAKGSVPVSIEEAARLQSFPDLDWSVVSKSRAFEIVGNAVPPLVAKHMIQAARGGEEVAPWE